MSAKSKVAYIVDRHEGTMVIFHRDEDVLGQIYYRPSTSSMARLARVLARMLEAKTVRIFETAPHIYMYDFVQRVDWEKAF